MKNLYFFFFLQFSVIFSLKSMFLPKNSTFWVVNLLSEMFIVVYLVTALVFFLFYTGQILPN